ncbi:hypothetical protein [uncultured Zobellia sp.]|uniref:hypothetical protein n=1 Tax=uncultured Zobellia sp. TaxID=255433 RepID=UPI002596A464|nr:hypothetical protein [uncultured Zobellia sp.]
MNLKHISLFNLIEIFSHPKKQLQTINANVHCEQKHHHDFYCDAEKPHVEL